MAVPVPTPGVVSVPPVKATDKKLLVPAVAERVRRTGFEAKANPPIPSAELL